MSRQLTTINTRSNRSNTNKYNRSTNYRTGAAAGAAATKMASHLFHAPINNLINFGQLMGRVSGHINSRGSMGIETKGFFEMLEVIRKGYLLAIFEADNKVRNVWAGARQSYDIVMTKQEQRNWTSSLGPMLKTSNGIYDGSSALVQFDYTAVSLFIGMHMKDILQSGSSTFNSRKSKFDRALYSMSVVSNVLMLMLFLSLYVAKMDTNPHAIRDMKSIHLVALICKVIAGVVMNKLVSTNNKIKSLPYKMKKGYEEALGVLDTKGKMGSRLIGVD